MGHAGLPRGGRIDVLYRIFRRYEIYIGIAAAVLLAVFIARKVYQHHNDDTASAAPDEH